MRLADAQQSTPWRVYLLRSEARGAHKLRDMHLPLRAPTSCFFIVASPRSLMEKKRSWFLCGLWLQGLTPRSQCSASVPPACALVSSAAPISSYRRFIKRNLRQILVIKLKKKTSLMWIFFGHHRGLVYWIWIESCLLRRLRKMGCPTPAGRCEVKDHHVAFGK